MKNSMTTEAWEPQLNLVLGALNEQQRRWVAGLMSEILGYGGITRVAAISGLDHKTIRRGRDDLKSKFEDCPQGRIRMTGAGRPRIQKK